MSCGLEDRGQGGNIAPSSSRRPQTPEVSPPEVAQRTSKNGERRGGMAEDHFQHADPCRENLDCSGKLFLSTCKIFHPGARLGRDGGDRGDLAGRPLNFSLGSAPKGETTNYHEAHADDHECRGDDSGDEHLVVANPVHRGSMPAVALPFPSVNPADLPIVSDDARFVDLNDVGDRANIVVDGPPTTGTVLALSHWPQARVPSMLSADTSTGIVARYLDAEVAGPAIQVVTNNHYDEDGILAIWMLLTRPRTSDPRRSLAIAAAEAGDFRTWTDPSAAKVSIALMTLVERATTPFPAVLRALSDRSGRDPAGALLAAVLPRVGDLLANPLRYERFWRPTWERLQPDLALVASGAVRIENMRDLDLAIVRSPRMIDPLALYPKISANRVLTLLPGGEASLVYRYESWVTYASRQIPPRVDLADLAARLQTLEAGSATWRFEGIDAITPRLAPFGDHGPTTTTIEHSRLVEEIATLFSRGALQ